LRTPWCPTAAVRRLEATALGSRALQRLTALAALAARLVGAEAATVSLLGDVETVVSGAGLPSGSLGRQVPPAGSLSAGAVRAGAGPLVGPLVDVALVAIRLLVTARRRVRGAQPRGSSAQTCLYPSRTYQPCCVDISAMR
jgi:hypothetical protein